MSALRPFEIRKQLNRHLCSLFISHCIQSIARHPNMKLGVMLGLPLREIILDDDSLVLKRCTWPGDAEPLTPPLFITFFCVTYSSSLSASVPCLFSTQLRFYLLTHVPLQLWPRVYVRVERRVRTGNPGRLTHIE